MNLTVIGYFTSWSIYQRGFKVANLPADVIDQVNYAFANIKNGLPVLGDQWADLALGSKRYSEHDWGKDRSDKFSNAILKELPINNPNPSSLKAGTTSSSSLKISTGSSKVASSGSATTSTMTFLSKISTENSSATITSGKQREDKLESMRGNFGELYQLKKKHPKLKTNLSIGGWTWSINFLPAANSTNSIKKFVNAVKEMVDEYGFDGVDLDWEYPKGPTENLAFLNMTREFREILGPNRTLSIAVACGDAKNDLLIGELAKVIDHFNLMSYDFTIAGIDPLTYHHSNLYSSSQRPGELSADSCVKYYQEHGAEARQIILGVPFYGRTFKNATLLRSKYDGPGKGSYEVGFIDYRDINCKDEKFEEDTKGAYCIQTQKTMKTMTRTVTQLVTQISKITEAMTSNCSQSSASAISKLNNSEKSTKSSNEFFTTLTISLPLGATLPSAIASKSIPIKGAGSASSSTSDFSRVTKTISVSGLASSTTIISTKLIEETFTVEVEVPFLIVYDGKRSIQEKLNYIKKLGLGGIMYWESSGDNGDIIEVMKQFKLSER